MFTRLPPAAAPGVGLKPLGRTEKSAIISRHMEGG